MQPATAQPSPITESSATAPLTAEVIERTIAGLPIQGRIMLRLLLLQYLDVTHDEILYMVADRPDPRCVSGKKPVTTMTQESITAMIDRRDEYRKRARLRRERTWLQCLALTNQARMAGSLAARAESLLAARGISHETIETLKSNARTAVPTSTLRLLEEQWDSDHISAEDYQNHRLAIELQTLLRFAERFKKRLDVAEREQQTSDRTILQDHEIGHIWGIPASTLAARKVKYLSQYLTAVQTACAGTSLPQGKGPSLDLWNETITVLSQTPIERSIPTYDGLERTESALIDKLATYVLIGIPEAVETKFWNSLVYGASSNAMHSETTRTLFGLQRLVAMQADVDTSPEALDEELLRRTSPTPKASELAEASDAGKAPQITELQQHILHNFLGEDVSGRASDKW